MKKHVYENQPLTVSLLTQTTLTDSTAQIRFKDPDGTTGIKEATTSDSTVSCAFAGGELNKPGLWEFRAWITFNGDSAVTPGTPARQIIEST
jgi:hypothetical protein